MRLDPITLRVLYKTWYERVANQVPFKQKTPSQPLARQPRAPRTVLLPIPGALPQPRSPPEPVTLDDHSKVDPLLPFPNRTVKRLRADDSGLPVCESRSSSGSYPAKPQHNLVLGFCLSGRLVGCTALPFKDSFEPDPPPPKWRASRPCHTPAEGLPSGHDHASLCGKIG